jgi:hypothetical protein
MFRYDKNIPRFLYLLDILIEHGAKIDGLGYSIVDVPRDKKVEDFLRHELWMQDYRDAERVLELIKIWRLRKEDCPQLAMIPRDVLLKHIIGENFKVSYTRPLAAKPALNDDVKKYIENQELRRQQERDARSIKALITIWKFRSQECPGLTRIPRDVFFQHIIHKNFSVSPTKALLPKPGPKLNGG